MASQEALRITLRVAANAEAVRIALPSILPTDVVRSAFASGG
jgi:hypothetical protein